MVAAGGDLWPLITPSVILGCVSRGKPANHKHARVDCCRRMAFRREKMYRLAFAAAAKNNSGNSRRLTAWWPLVSASSWQRAETVSSFFAPRGALPRTHLPHHHLCAWRNRLRALRVDGGS